MKKIIIIVLLAVVAGGCGGPEMPPMDSLSSHKPRVLAILPADGSVALPETVVMVEFSEQIDFSSINSASLAVIKTSPDSETKADPVEAIVKGKTSGLDGIYGFEGDGRIITFAASSPYQRGAKYSVIATEAVMSVARLPLAKASSSASAPFVSTFVIEDEDGEEGSPAGDSGQVSGAPEGSASQSQGADSGEGTAAKEPSFIVINELLYDIPGDDSDGKVFVELFGEGGGDISGYKILFISGDDGKISATLEIPKDTKIPADGIYLVADSKTGEAGVSNVAGAHLIRSFDPPNGPDCVELLDSGGKLADAMGYGSPLVDTAANGLKCFEGTSALKVPAGQSLSRTAGGDTDNNAADFSALPQPTPGIK